MNTPYSSILELVTYFTIFFLFLGFNQYRFNGTFSENAEITKKNDVNYIAST